jgi:uncharacterized protein YbdZ (MbtH family)
MTRHQKIAAKALADRLRDREDPIVLFDAVCIMDEAARAAGRKSELFGSLWDYADYLPSGWTTAWLTTSDRPGADSMAYAIPPGWREGSSNSETLLLGGGALRRADRMQLNPMI